MHKRVLGRSGLEVSALRLQENLGAAALVLTPDELGEIKQALDEIEVQGDRYPAALAAMVGR